MSGRKGILWGCSSPELNIAVIAAQVLGQRKAKLVLIDSCDYGWVSQHRWFISWKGYCIRNTKINGKWMNIRLHREVLKTHRRRWPDRRSREQGQAGL